jgi:hypothetical protein
MNQPNPEAGFQLAEYASIIQQYRQFFFKGELFLKLYNSSSFVTQAAKNYFENTKGTVK